MSAHSLHVSGDTHVYFHQACGFFLFLYNSQGIVGTYGGKMTFYCHFAESKCAKYFENQPTLAKVINILGFFFTHSVYSLYCLLLVSFYNNTIQYKCSICTSSCCSRIQKYWNKYVTCLLYTSPSPRD